MFKTFTRGLLVLLLFLVHKGYTQQKDDDRLFLKHGVVSGDSPLWKTGEQLNSFLTENRSSEHILGIIRFDRPPAEGVKEKLESEGIHLQGYIPNNAWVAVISKQAAGTRQLSSLGFRGFLPITAEMKANAGLLEGNLSAAASTVAGMADLWIRFPDFYGADSVKKWLREKSVEVLSEEFKTFGVLEIRVAVDDIRALAGLNYIEYIQEKPAPDTIENYKSPVRSRSNVLRSESILYPGGLKGRNVVIGVGDDTDPLRHIDFSDRLINRFNTINGSGHGLHTMGTIGGAGIIREELTGYAPKSKLISHYFSNIIGFSPTFYIDFGMRLTNNSYGVTVTSDESFRRYDITSWIVDFITTNMPDFLHVFAAGNSGLVNFPTNPYRASVSGETGFGTVVTGFQSAKNTLVVGNIDSLFVRNSQSSRGPLQDGRLRPDVVTEGMRIESALRDNTYGRMSGTSMAAPAVTGGAALLSEQFMLQYPSAGSPPAGFLKALICNGATDLGNAGPDYSFGFGAMNLLRSSEMLKNESYVVGSVNTGNDQDQTITIPSNTARLKVMLYWTDPPGNILASKALVNDLDLTVTIGGSTSLPFVNSTFPALVKNPATTGVDRLNNIEQIVIENPAAGPAVLSINGYNVPVGPQTYYLVYDIIPAGTTLTAPSNGERHFPGEKMLIVWDSHGPETGFDLEFFDGTTWSPIVDGLAPSTRQYYWTIPAGTATDGAKVRITRTLDNEVSTGNEFVVIGRPTLSLAAAAQQCEGMIGVNWTAVPDASGYEVMKLQGDEMVAVATLPASQENYNFTGLSKDSTYWVSVRALIGNSAGLRAVAISRRPNTGSCANPISDGDLALTALVSPTSSGRLLTSTALTAGNEVRIKIKNLDDAASPSRSAVISCTVNSQPPVTENITLPAIPVAGEHEITFSSGFDLSAVGSYRIEVSLATTGDQIPANNVLVAHIAQLSNPPVVLSLTPSVVEHNEDFSGLTDSSYYHRQIGMEGADRYDFESSDPGGRARSFVNTGIARSPNRAVTVDADAYPHVPAINYFTGTYNLAAYGSGEDIRLNFWYLSHGQPTEPENKVWVRGQDTDPWIEVYDLSANQAEPGEDKRSSSIELTDLLSANGQQFSSSTQIRWGQKGSYQAATALGINGFTFDDVRISIASDDIQLKEILSPGLSNCNLGSQEPITVRVYNSMSYPMSNVPISYQIDDGPVVTESIASIPASSEMSFTFAAEGDFSTYRSYNIKAWVSAPDDNEPFNNEVSLTVTNSPLIATFPYLESFESNNGYWFTGGNSPSWEYGTPSSTQINRAASGTKAWKTRLAGHYNDLEHSYLYSPCFSLENLSNPTLSFMVALDIENCAEPTFCDGAWVEYSYDGINWSRLGNKNDGTNWYNRDYEGRHVWSVANYSRWHVATIPLPPSANPNEHNIRIRFVLNSDLAVNREGIAIDDIHVYDRFANIATAPGNGPVVNRTIASGDADWTHFTDDNELSVSLNPNGSSPVPGSVNSQSFLNTGSVRNAFDTYYHNRNFVIQPSATTMTPGALVRLYFSDAEMETMRTANGCSGCLNAASVLDLGISKYSKLSEENGTVSDNTANGNWLFIPAPQVSKVPFGSGYYVELVTTGFSEFWLSPAAIFDTSPLPVKLTSFTARLGENNTVDLDWGISEISGFSHFEIQRANGNDSFSKGDFRPIGTVRPGEAPLRSYRFTDPAPGSAIVYYRLKMVDTDGSYQYSDIRSVLIDQVVKPLVYPNPSTDGIFLLHHQAVGPVEYKVSDATGRNVKSGTLTGDGFLRKTPIDLRDLSQGIYLIEVSTGESRTIFKVVKL